jgi:hypothetical protein
MAKPLAIASLEAACDDNRARKELNDSAAPTISAIPFLLPRLPGVAIYDTLRIVSVASFFCLPSVGTENAVVEGKFSTGFGSERRNNNGT